MVFKSYYNGCYNCCTYNILQWLKTIVETPYSNRYRHLLLNHIRLLFLTDAFPVYNGYYLDFCQKNERKYHVVIQNHIKKQEEKDYIFKLQRSQYPYR